MCPRSPAPGYPEGDRPVARVPRGGHRGGVRAPPVRGARPGGPGGAQPDGSARPVVLARRSNRCSNRGMRWDELRLTDDAPPAPSATLPLLPRGAVTRTFDTPEFAGMTFHEVTCRVALNKVPEASRMPFRWTINPYRGCAMACVLLLRPQDARVPRPRLGPRLRLADRGQDQRRRGPPPRAAPAVLARRARGDGHQRRLLPARRGPLPADARDHPGADRGGQPVLDPDQGRADPARPRPARPRPPR